MSGGTLRNEMRGIGGQIYFRICFSDIACFVKEILLQFGALMESYSKLMESYSKLSHCEL